MVEKSTEEIYAEVRDFPLPRNPFRDLVIPHINELFADCDEWIDADSPFESETARDVQKSQLFTDISYIRSRLAVPDIGGIAVHRSLFCVLRYNR